MGRVAFDGWVLDPLVLQRKIESNCGEGSTLEFPGCLKIVSYFYDIFLKNKCKIMKSRTANPRK